MRRTTKKKRKGLLLFDKIVLGLNCILVLCLLLSYLAPGTNPRDNSIIAILGLGYLGLSAINIIFIIYWLCRLRGYYALISVITIFFGFNIITYHFNFHGGSGTPEKRIPGNNIRIMSYNVHKFDGIEQFEGKAQQAPMIELIKKYQPDIVNMMEFSLNDVNKKHIVDSLKKALNVNYYYFKVFKKTRSDSTGNAIFSKFPIIDSGYIPRPGSLITRAMFVDLQYGKKIIRVYAVHLASIHVGKNRDKYLNGDLDLGQSSAIKNGLAAAFLNRSVQISRIKSHMEKCPYPYILAGDFNDTPNSFAVNELGDGLKNAFREKGSGFETTYYSTYPLHIDHIFVSPQFDILNYRAIDKKLSDHKPIISDLRLN